MFYSQYILAKRGPLGTIWIAAHLDRKLRKNQIAETDIVSSVSTYRIRTGADEATGTNRATVGLGCGEGLKDAGLTWVMRVLARRVDH